MLCFLQDAPQERLWVILPSCTYQDPGPTTPDQIAIEKVEYIWMHFLYCTLRLILHVLFFALSPLIFKASAPLAVPNGITKRGLFSGFPNTPPASSGCSKKHKEAEESHC